MNKFDAIPLEIRELIDAIRERPTRQNHILFGRWLLDDARDAETVKLCAEYKDRPKEVTVQA